MPVHQAFDLGAARSLPLLRDNIQQLKYIGPLFAARFHAEGITTMRDLVDEFKNNSQAENRALLNRVLKNPRSHIAGGAAAQGCLGRGSRRRNHAGVRAGNRYWVRQRNAFAFNAIITWFMRKAARHRGRVMHDIVVNRLPGLKLRRNYPTAFPANCA